MNTTGLLTVMPIFVISPTRGHIAVGVKNLLLNRLNASISNSPQSKIKAWPTISCLCKI